MSESIYNDIDCSSINTSADKTETTYANAVNKGSRQKLQLSKIKPGGRNRGCSELALVFLGLLSVLLLAATFVLCIMARQLQLTNDRHEVHKQVKANMIKDLEARNSDLIRENKQLQARNTTLTAEKLQLETNFRAMTGERDELQRRLCKLESESMKQIKFYAVDVTLDPDTAQSYLLLSADGKQVSHGDTAQNVPDSPKRFSRVVIVLGKQGFSSGRFYYEVQVKGKTAWDLGVARESITRKGDITLSPNNGYWTIWLRNRTEYKALANPDVPLSLKEKPQRVGVFVDYGAGLVSFYDADSWFLLYSYTNAAFNETLYPYFSPYLNGGGINSSPLIITSVSKQYDCMA